MLVNSKNKVIPLNHFELKRVAVIILGGGEGKRLFPLTQNKCKPAIPFGGRYTLIDIPISHALLSGFCEIFIIGQYLADTLHTHIHKTYHAHGDLHLLTPENNEVFEGTADAVRKNLAYFKQVQADYFLILSGDHLYNIDFKEMILQGISSDADLVIATNCVGEKEAKRMGVLQIDGDKKVTDFYEKPQTKELLKQFKQREGYLASMGIYLFKKKSLFQLLQDDLREDFGKHLIPTQMKKGGVFSYIYKGYWEDIGTIESYYHANLALTREEAGFNCYDEAATIMTKSHHLPGAKIKNCLVNHSLICEGSLVAGGEISGSIIGTRSVLKAGSVIKDSILIGNSYYSNDSHCPTIGERCIIEKAILDENVTLGKGVKLRNKSNYLYYDDPRGRFFVRDGIIIVPSGVSLPANFQF